MMKKIALIAPAVILIFTGLMFYLYFADHGQVENTQNPANSIKTPSHADALNTNYTTGDLTVPLYDGYSAIPAAPGSNAAITTRALDPVAADLDNDGNDDAALWLAQSRGGSGTFYYAAAAMQEDGSCRQTAAMFLGDRIAPRDLSVQNGIMAYEYLKTADNEPMSAEPSVKTVKYLTLRNGELLEVNTKDDLITVDQPIPGSVITSPLTITGQARGTWYFEADFPVVLTDWDGRIIAEGVATAQDEWMTEKYVPFRAIIHFEKPDIIGDFARRGALILQKDNPSGLPENDNALEMTVYFE